MKVRASVKKICDKCKHINDSEFNIIISTFPRIGKYKNCNDSESKYSNNNINIYKKHIKKCKTTYKSEKKSQFEPRLLCYQTIEKENVIDEYKWPNILSKETPNTDQNQMYIKELQERLEKD